MILAFSSFLGGNTTMADLCDIDIDVIVLGRAGHRRTGPAVLPA